MNNKERLLKLQQACRQYLLDIAGDGEYIGIVEFEGGSNSGTAKILAPLTQITNETRTELVDKLPKTAQGWTSIGKGLEVGIDVLSELNGEAVSPNGGYFLVVSDGEENKPPYIADLQGEIIEKQITVDSLAVGVAASAKLEELATETGGLLFFFNEDTTSNALNEALIEIGARGASKQDLPVTLLSDSMTIEESTYNVTRMFYVDASVGRRTKMNFGYSGTASKTIEVVVYGPDNAVWDENSDEYELDEQFQSVGISIDELAKPGEYWCLISNPSNEDKTVTITVTSYSVEDGAYPITAEAKWKFTEITPPEKQVLFVGVYQGYGPILNANVTANIERPGAESYTLQMYDDGAGADVTKNDGIYSQFFTSFTEDGRYSVTVVVNNEDVDSVISSKMGFRRGVPMRTTKDLQAMQETGEFQRYANGGSFTLSEFSASENYYPPNDITDLRVGSISKEELLVSLEWTAPGASLDTGTAAYYELFMSEDFDALVDDTTNQIQIKEEQVQLGSLSAPLESGSTENITVELTNITLSDTETIFWFALWAYDGTGNNALRSGLSNVVSATFRNFPPPEEPEDSNLGLILGLVFGILALIIIVIVIIYCCCCNKDEDVTLKV